MPQHNSFNKLSDATKKDSVTSKDREGDKNTDSFFFDNNCIL